MKRLGRRGFTFVEILIVMIVISILAGIMVMRYIELKHRALTAQATSDMETVRLAAFTKFYDTGIWPADPGQGVVPPELTPYLGQGFSFVRPDYTLEFENFTPPGGGTSATYQVAIRFSSTNQKLVNTMIQVVGDRAPYVVLGSDVAVILVGPDGQT
ncbi:MAG TPA: type II secretion system protein [Gemmatimonadales bacterium]|jgi:prepilin-type N-terminal cleavage/methylation domain-containing protein|nr:type II secretion system protein [Gemmatimonadales bacterium]